MRVLLAHVAHVHRGGEEVVVETESNLLRGAGHQVYELIPHSGDFASLDWRTQTRIVTGIHDHEYGRRLICQAVKEFAPDVVHFHNLFPLLGPGAVATAAALGCATVQTLHNYRLSCIAGTHLRCGVRCESCSPCEHSIGLARRCYRGSWLQSAVMARGTSAHWCLMRDQGLPQRTICLTGAIRDRMLTLGLPDPSISVKGNSVDEGKPTSFEARDGACFVGRLSEEKGIVPLLEEWDAQAPRLAVLGEGPLRCSVERVCAAKPNLEYIGSGDKSAVRDVLRSSRVLVFPSMWWDEVVALVVMEALSEGTPVVAFDYSSCRKLEETAALLTVGQGNIPELVRAARDACSLDRDSWARRSEHAVRAHRDSFSHRNSLERLEYVYEEVLGFRTRRC